MSERVEGAGAAGVSAETAHITWAGAGDHTGHTIQFRERWRHQIEGATVIFTEPKLTIRDGVLTAGRVQCSCGEGWSVGGWPPEVIDQIEAVPLVEPDLVNRPGSPTQPTAAPSAAGGADGGAGRG